MCCMIWNLASTVLSRLKRLYVIVQCAAPVVQQPVLSLDFLLLLQHVQHMTCNAGTCVRYMDWL
jgi:hypothetical protein